MSLRNAIVCIVAASLMVTPGFATTYKSPDGTLTLSARSVEIYTDKLVAAGKAHVKWVDPQTKATLEADAEKIVAKVAVGKGAKPAKGSTPVQSADLTGPVKMVYTIVDANGATSKIVATADSADFDGATNLAHLVGHVKITNENPAVFAEPAVMVGDKATVNLAPNPGPDDFRFRVESAPGVSSITVTPKAKEN